MTNLSYYYYSLQSSTQEKSPKFTQRLDVCEVLILDVLLKKVTRKPVKESLNPCVQIFFIYKKETLHFLSEHLCARDFLHIFSFSQELDIFLVILIYLDKYFLFMDVLILYR